MFRERLKVLGKNTFNVLKTIAYALLLFAGLAGLGFLTVTFPLVETVIATIMVILFLLAVLIIIACLLLHIYDFIKWLFIEPFKNKNKHGDQINEK